MLVSLKAGNCGINLTRASYVFLMDLWWNSAVEDQAADRVHRIGQTRPVFVTRFICAGTVEERVVQIQQRKAAMGKGALGRLTAEEMRAVRMQDLRTIFDMRRGDDNG